MNIKITLAALTAAVAAFSLTACAGNSDKSSSDGQSSAESITETSVAIESAEEPKPDISGQTIKWFSYYDLNPSGSESRSIALTLFEDVYGGKVEWVPTTYKTMYDDLANAILSGSEIDMIPYDTNAVPYGVMNNQYQPLDDYIDLGSELWSGVSELADRLEYNGSHYIVPYSISEPVCLIYSRKMMKDYDLDDPYELYEKGEWDWDVFMSMMNKFTENGGDYGCAGWLGKAFVQSCGQPFVNYDGEKFTNNLSSPEIEQAELILENISASGLYDDEWYTYFPDNGSVLFYAMDSWALGESNGMNPDEDIFLVPFPKMPGSDKYYMNCEFDAKMLAAGSDKGEAVAAYLECERLAVTEEKYVAVSREKALTPVFYPSAQHYITEEQLDALESIMDSAEPVIDFGYGMGRSMYAETYDYSTRGAMLNLSDALISGYEGSPSEWSELRDSMNETVDKAISEYN